MYSKSRRWRRNWVVARENKLSVNAEAVEMPAIHIGGCYGSNTTHHSSIETMAPGGCVSHFRTCFNDKQGLRVSSHGHPVAVD